MISRVHKEDKDGACPRAAELPGWLLGEVQDAGRTPMERHVAECPYCASTAAKLRPVVAALRAAPARLCAPDLTARIMARVPWDRRDAHRMSRGWTGWMVRAAAVLLALLGLSLSLWRRGGPEGEDHAGAPSSRRRAVAGARAWLRQAQGPDGLWAAGSEGDRHQYDVGVSAMALMALMDNDPEAFRGPNAEAIRRGVDSLLACQNDEGLLGPVFSGAPYNQGLGTLALLNAVALADHEPWRAAAGRALACLVKIQDEQGGWAYLGRGRDAVNTSISIWPLWALIRADELGFPGLEEPIERGRSWLETAINSGGRAGYRRAGDFPYGHETMTAAGALCLLLLPEAERHHEVVERMLAALRQSAGQGQDAPDYYRTFFVAQALARAGDRSSARIAEQLGDALAAGQQQAGRTAGSWEAHDRWGRVGGRVYATALAAMTLGLEENRL